MDNAKIKEIYAHYENWLAEHSHRDRVMFLLAGWILIYLIWYNFCQKPINVATAQLNQEIVTNQAGLKVFQNEISHISKEGQQLALQKKRTEQLSKNNPAPQTVLASKKDNDLIIQAILTPQTNVNFTSLISNGSAEMVSNKQPVDNSLQVSFNSSYFPTIAYLHQLEKLPWCLSWDSLEYKVNKYPQATVIINLHIVNS
jgi:MSHA biogenesis protein MshJ